MKSETIEIYAKIIAIYSLLLLLIGTCGNILSLFICLKKKLRQNNTFILTSFTLLIDIVTLYFWNLDHYLYAFNQYQVPDINIHFCRLSIFFQCFSFQWSAWLLVFMSLERYLNVRIKKWRKVYFKPKSAVVSSVVLGIVIFTINTVLTINVNYDASANETCVYSYFTPIYMQVNLFLYGILPEILIIISNALLISEVLCKKETTITHSIESIKKRRSLSITVILQTTAFIVFTLPQTIVLAFFLGHLVNTDTGWILIFLLDCFVCTYHSLNFIILSTTNKIFSNEIKQSARRLCKGNKVIDSQATTTL